MLVEGANMTEEIYKRAFLDLIIGKGNVRCSLCGLVYQMKDAMLEIEEPPILEF